MIPKWLYVMWAAMARTASKRLRQLALTAGIAGVAFFGLLKVSPILAQSSPSGAPPQPSFEVASIKPNRSVGRSSSIGIPTGGFAATNVTSEMLIEFAYRGDHFNFNIWPQDEWLSGGHGWLNSERYDVGAKMDDATVQMLQKLPIEQRSDYIKLAVRSLLAERFNLKVSHEIRNLPVYALVVAKEGPKLTPSIVPVPDASDANPPRAGAERGPMMMTGHGQIDGVAAPIGKLADMLSRELHREVLDQTGLKGRYDFTLRWTPDETHAAMFKGPEGSSPGLDNTPPPESSGPSLFTAIQEQLGLKLESTKGPVEIIVIDHIERPSEN